MTPDELQELDSYLAQHIMEWEPVDPSDPSWPKRRNPSDPLWVRIGEDGDGYYESDWHPSSNPAQALEVAEGWVQVGRRVQPPEKSRKTLHLPIPNRYESLGREACRIPPPGHLPRRSSLEGGAVVSVMDDLLKQFEWRLDPLDPEDANSVKYAKAHQRLLQSAWDANLYGCRDKAAELLIQNILEVKDRITFGWHTEVALKEEDLP